MPNPRTISRAELVEQLLELGVEPGGVLLVHTAFRAVRPVEGGPVGLIEALREALGPDGTLVMPCWADTEDEPFDPRTTGVDEDLGITPKLFREQPGVLRSNHSEAFAAIGPKAKFILADPMPVPPHIPASPVGRVHDLNGRIALLGVGHSSNTTLHLAEVLVRVPYGFRCHYTELRDGRKMRIDFIENECCCERFALADDWLRQAGLQREGPVGHAHARMVRSRDLVAVALERLRNDPLLFLHPSEAGCARCDEARRHDPF